MDLCAVNERERNCLRESMIASIVAVSVDILNLSRHLHLCLSIHALP
jgi:hypothetical protein